MVKFLVGVDAGGTKTHAAVMDTDGHILGVGIAGVGNWERSGMQNSCTEIRSAVMDALNESGIDIAQVSAATFALAGIDWESDRVAMKECINDFGFTCDPVVMNDALAVLFAGTQGGIGCASIAGTGGKTVGRDGVKEVATLGMAVGEGGGAGQVVSETLRVCAEMQHGQRPRTPMLAAVVEAAGFSAPEDFFQAIARDTCSFDESYAPLCFTLADAGDPAAINIIETVATQHARDVIGVVRQLNFDGAVPLVRAGGLHTAESRTFNTRFDDEIAESDIQVESSILEAAPVVGALIHAAISQSGAISAVVRAQLLSDAMDRNGDFRNHNASDE